VGGRKLYSILSRTQIPLIAGLTMTTNKSQDMALDKVLVNVSRAFAGGQISVALSRARSLEGLKMEALDSDIECNE
jgi:ATP-dependent DNA helicase PIF1